MVVDINVAFLTDIYNMLDVNMNKHTNKYSKYEYNNRFNF